MGTASVTGRNRVVCAPPIAVRAHIAATAAAIMEKTAAPVQLTVAHANTAVTAAVTMAKRAPVVRGTAGHAHRIVATVVALPERTVAAVLPTVVPVRIAVTVAAITARTAAPAPRIADVAMVIVTESFAAIIARASITRLRPTPTVTGKVTRANVMASRVMII